MKCLETSVKDFLLADNILHSARTESSAGTFSHMGINSSTMKKIPILCLFTSKWFSQTRLNLPPLCCRFWLRLVPPAHFLPPRSLLRLPKKKWKWKHIRRYNRKIRSFWLSTTFKAYTLRFNHFPFLLKTVMVRPHSKVYLQINFWLVQKNESSIKFNCKIETIHFK